MATQTLGNLADQLERRIHQLRATTSPASESEIGNLLADNAIYDAINVGRRQVMIDVMDAHLWGETTVVITMSVATTLEYAVDDDALLWVESVLWNTTSSGFYQAGTVEAHDVKNRRGEESAIANPFNTPSATNPKYWMTNGGKIRFVTSTNGTLAGVDPATVYAKVNYIKEPTILTAVGNNTGFPATLDDMSVHWAIWVIMQDTMPQLANLALQAYSAMVKALNEVYILRQRRIR